MLDAVTMKQAIFLLKVLKRPVSRGGAGGGGVDVLAPLRIVVHWHASWLNTINV